MHVTCYIWYVNKSSNKYYSYKSCNPTVFTKSKYYPSLTNTVYMTMYPKGSKEYWHLYRGRWEHPCCILHSIHSRHIPRDSPECYSRILSSLKHCPNMHYTNNSIPSLFNINSRVCLRIFVSVVSLCHIFMDFMKSNVRCSKNWDTNLYYMYYRSTKIKGNFTIKILAFNLHTAWNYSISDK